MLTAAALAMWLVESLKALVRTATKNPDYDFSPAVLAALLVAANAAAVLILATLDVMGYEFPQDWTAWVKALVLALLNAVVSSALFNFGFKPFRQFAEKYSPEKHKAVETKKAKK